VSYQGNNEIIILFVKHQFGWGPAYIGYYEAADAATQGIGMMVVPWLITRWLGVYIDLRWLFVGYVFRTVHFFLFAMAPDTTTLFGLVPLLLFAANLTPRSRTIVSNSVESGQQAAIMSGFSAVQSVASFSVPLVALGYSYTVYFDPAFMFYVFSALCGVGAMMILVALHRCPVKAGSIGLCAPLLGSGTSSGRE
jgi:hypothetical protein